jgi:hypothetical protein
VGRTLLPDDVCKIHEENKHPSRDVFRRLRNFREEMFVQRRRIIIIIIGRRRNRRILDNAIALHRADDRVHARVSRWYERVETERVARCGHPGGRVCREIAMDEKTDRLGSREGVCSREREKQSEENEHDKNTVKNWETRHLVQEIHREPLRRQRVGERVFGVGARGVGYAGRFERNEFLTGRTGGAYFQRQVQIRHRRRAIAEIEHAKSWELFRF